MDNKLLSVKKRWLLLLLCVMFRPAGAQSPVVPNDATGPLGGVTQRALPVAFNQGGNQMPTQYNYRRVWEPQRAIKDNSYLMPTALYVPVTTTYLNGYGQPLQMIRKNAGFEKDIIVPYDNRSSLIKMSFPAYEAQQHSLFQADPFGDQKSYYQSKYAYEGGASYGYTRVGNPGHIAHSATAHPGKSHAGQGRESAVGIYPNAVTQEVRIWEIINTPNGDKLSFAKLYQPGELTVRITWDPVNVPVLECYNKNDQLVMKEVRNGSEQLRTYYVYDDLGRLRYVVPPWTSQVFVQAGAPWELNYIATAMQCFKYVYNEYGLLIEKSSAGEHLREFFVYDRKKRLVLHRSPLLSAANQWSFTIYDSRDRVVMSGLVNSTNASGAWQTLLNGTPTTGTLADYLVNGFRGTYPSSIPDCDIRQFNYYDTYNQHGDLNRSFNYSYGNEYDPGSGISAPEFSKMTNGLLTGSRTKVVNPGVNDGFERAWVNSVYFYDRYSRLVQTHTQNPWHPSGGWNILATQYNFTGKKIIEIFDHHAWPGADKSSTNVIKRYEYHLSTGQVSRVRQRTDGGTPRDISLLSYDAFGRLSQKSLGGVERQQYEYNIRGELTAVNRKHATDPACSNNCGHTFGEVLSYDYGFSQPRYDGKIAGFQWRGSSATRHTYGYTYDGASRLTVADYSQKTGNGSWNRSPTDYSVSGISYDANGNILSLKQKAPVPPNSGSQLMDDLTYTYDAGTNRLDRIEDAATHHTGRDFLNNNASTSDYTYDANGNLSSDKNKGVSNITYNHLNLPVSVTTDAGHTIANVYDAAGNLLQKTITPSGGPAEVYRYWGPFTYRDDELLYFLHEEGRCRWQVDSNQFKYDYFVKDHLDNVRSVVTADVTSPGNYAASHELSKAQAENLVFGGINETRVPLPPDVPQPIGDTTNQYVIELEGSDPDKRVGTSLLLRVMAGDRFDVESLAFYGEPEDEDDNVYTDDNSMLNAIFTSFVNGFNPAYAEEGWGAYEQLGQFFGNTGNMTAWNALKEAQTDPDRPRAYVNYMVFDNNMELVQDQSGVLQVGGRTGFWDRVRASGTEIAIQQNGYIAFFLSNEHFRRVWFDNLYLVHYRGRLIEEHHYYPHGLTLKDEVAPNHEPNPYLYQTKKLQNEVGLKLHDFHARQYDAQIGRFWGIDPADQFPSGYTGMGNDPANMVDPTGMFSIGVWFSAKSLALGAYIHGFFSKGGSISERDRQGKNVMEQKFNAMVRVVNGQFKGNPHQMFSRHHWESFQNGVGLGYGLAVSYLYDDVDVKYFDGATVITSPYFNKKSQGSAVAIGSYIFGNSNRLKAKKDNQLFMHEYGHYLQSQASGPLYLYKYGMPSALTGLPGSSWAGYPGWHTEFWVERDASTRAWEYFKKNHELTNWDDDIDPRGAIRNVRWWEPFAFMIDPVSIIRLSRFN